MGAKLLIKNSQGKYRSNLEATDKRSLIKQDGFQISIHTEEREESLY
jgi:hypothetical protein